MSWGMVRERKRGNGLLRVELSMWKTWRGLRGLFSIWTMFSDAEERVWAFVSFTYLLLCLFALVCCSHVQEGEMGFAYTEIYLMKILWTCSFKTITHLCSWTVNLNLKPKKPGLFPFSMATSVSLPQPNSSLTKLSSLIIWIISHANWFVF